MVGRPINENRMLAEINGERVYRGSTHGCGTNERYTKGGGCVYCARRLASEQRDALADKRAAESGLTHIFESAEAMDRRVIDALGLDLRLAEEVMEADSANAALDNPVAPVYPEPWD